MLTDLTFVNGRNIPLSMNPSRKLLFVNVSKQRADDITHLLWDDGLQFLQCRGYTESMQMARIHIPDIFVIMESRDGTGRGLRLVREIRENTGYDHSQILYVCLEATEEAQMLALQSGAEDILPEQVSDRIMATRIASLLKRTLRGNLRPRTGEQFIVDPSTFTVSLEGRKIQLVKKEFELLHLLCSAPNRIFYRQEILMHIWKGINLKSDRTLDVHIRKLRRKLGIPHIKTVNGVGYKFEWPAA